jgi:hypothetical protein
MRTFLILLVCLFLAPTPLHAADTLFRISEVALIAAHGSDLATTQNCIGRGVCHELNPYLGRFKEPLVFGAAKMGVAAGSIWLTDRLHEHHRFWAILVNAAGTSVFFTVAAHNARVSR